MNADISQYSAAVAAALADLPQAARDDLLEDLPEHLAEVAAEARAEGVTLTDKLGPPSAYAAELRASMGHETRHRFVRVSDRIARLKARTQPLNVGVGNLLGYAHLTDLLRQLRPAWWVLRGYLAAQFIGQVAGDMHTPSVIPQFDGNGFIGVLLIAACVLGSFWLGRRAVDGERRLRFVSAAVSAGLTIFALAVTVFVDQALTNSENYSNGDVVNTSQWQPQDVAVVDSQGRPIGPVGIVDLDGQNYLDITVHTCDGMLPWEGDRWPLLITLCGKGSPSPAPSAVPSPSSVPRASAVPSPSR